MNAKWLRSTAAFFVAASLVLAQAQSDAPTLNQTQKKEVIDAIGKTLVERAFVPNIDFGTWPELVRRESDMVERSSTPAAFTATLNRLLRTYGISHIRLSPGSGRVASAPSLPSVNDVLLLVQEAPLRRETLTIVGEIAVLRVPTFSDGYSRENIEEDAKGLILDLRRNGGGASSNLNHLLSLILPPNTEYGVFLSRRIVSDWQRAHPNEEVDLGRVATWTTSRARTRPRGIDPFKGPIAVMIDRGSASASEITAAALKENADAILVGSPSAGAVLASVNARLPLGFSLQYPVSDYITTKGRRLEKQPLEPDVKEAGRVTSSDDPVRAAALKAVRAKLNEAGA
jgi:nucleotide-binding universal stress UspA family protein